MSKEMRLRVAQLDLARQMETIDFIKGFIDFIAEHEYNAIALYLEARIRTKSFPFPSPDDSYDVDEIKEIVDYAASQKVEVIPAMAMLGHMENFFKHKELEHLAETRDTTGRFGNTKNVICPSLDESYTFIEQYLEEIAAIFPSDYMHVGCDEAWDMGLCELCAKRGGQDAIFTDHVNKLHDIVHGKLGKKMIMWDDLFENYPAALDNIPKDIIMCVWHYDQVVDIPRAHFGNRLRIDKLKQYDKQGISYFIAPWERSLTNIKTFSKYASNHTPLGGWLTNWEWSESFFVGYYLNFAFAGRLWAGHSAENLLEQCARRVLGENIPTTLINALENILNQGVLGKPASTAATYRRGPLSGTEITRKLLVELTSSLIKEHAPNIQTKLGQDILTDLEISCEVERLHFSLRELFTELDAPDLTDNERESIKSTLFATCAANVQELKRKRQAQWRTFRQGLSDARMVTNYDQLDDLLQRLATNDSKGFLHVHLCLPEYHSAQTCEFSVQYNNSDEWETVSKGVFKNAASCNSAFYTYSFPIRAIETPRKLRIESWGYGGQGITYAEIANTAGRFIPSSISRIEGIVDCPAFVLSNDDKWCFLGNRDTRREFTTPSLADEKHIIEINLTKM